MNITDPSTITASFFCPVCAHDALRFSSADDAHSALVCSKCAKAFPIRDDIIEFIDARTLDEFKAKELEGNMKTYSANPSGQLQKGSWTYYHRKNADRIFSRLSRLMRGTISDTIVSLGSGAAWEVEELLRFPELQSVRTIYSSDIALAATRLVAQRFAAYDVNLVLFTSDLDHCPLKLTQYPVLIFEALHHTPDMHRTIESLLAAGYAHVYFCEPTENFIMRGFQKLGLSRRVEYSGVTPDRLSIQRLLDIAKRHGYASTIDTLWILPEDYFRRMFGKIRAENLCIRFTELLSRITKPFMPGNYSAVHLRKI